MSVESSRIQSLLESLLEGLPIEPADLSTLKPSQRTKLRQAINRTIEELQLTVSSLDSIRQPPHVFDPSDPDVIGKLIAETLLIQPRHKLSELDQFYGSGVYAIYYRGRFPTYRLIAGTERPIYVGKADPASPNAISPSQQGTRLWGRLQDHRKTISSAITTLKVADFDCRFLVVTSAWQSTAETYLIDGFKPVWNSEVGICYGFGKHGDAATTRLNTRSPWDTLHPGRRWAGEGNKPNPLSAAEISRKIIAHFKKTAELTRIA